MTSHEHFQLVVNTHNAIEGNYEPTIVLISFLIAVIAGFCALSVNHFIVSQKAGSTIHLKVIGGVILGFGVWSMHFAAMSAFTLPVKVYYDVLITVISVLPAILASIIVLHYLSLPNITKKQVVGVALVLTLGISLMHMVGMTAMSMKASMVYDLRILTISVVISWLMSASMLLVITGLSAKKLNEVQRTILGAFFFGFSVASMHYLAMAASYFFSDDLVVVSGVANKVIERAVVGSIIILMLLLLVITHYKNKIRLLELDSLKEYKRTLDIINNMRDGFVFFNDSGEMLLINKQFNDEFGHQKELFKDGNFSIFDMYEDIISTKFRFSGMKEKQEVLRKILDTEDAEDYIQIQSHDDKWWMLRKNKTNINGVIHTWSDITHDMNQKKRSTRGAKKCLLWLGW